MNYSNPLLCRARRLGQRLGILAPAQWAYRRIRPAGYEERFGAAMLAEIRPGDTVWDVGANVGQYAVEFARAVGDAGGVVAFEPNPEAFEVLERAAGNVRAVNVALSDADGEVDFYLAPERAAPDSGMTPAAGRRRVRVAAVRGDSFLAEHPDLAPACIKVDVEGFEAEVLRGLSGALTAQSLRCVFVEVHFSVLNRRGTPGAPADIQNLLAASGFLVRWVDPSHLIASRRP